MSFFSKIFGDPHERFLRGLKPIVEQINTLEKDFEKLAPEDFPKKTEELKKQLKKGASLEDILPEAFALTREAAKRTIGQRHFDVQLLGGIVLHQGKISEMKTGEGKTLVATLAAYLNALTEKGVHIVTVNDYLARRDTTWMGPIYHYLGISVGCLNHEASYAYDPSFGKKEAHDEEKEASSYLVHHEFLRPITRHEAYRCDITYGTNNEYGFDYLRDNLVYDLNQFSERLEDEGGFNFAIVDEIDSILIDEARTPLIISAPFAESDQFYKKFAKIAEELKEGPDFNIDEKMRAVSITQEGITKVEKILGVENLYTEKGIKFVHHLEQALRAKALFHRDKDYVVKEGEVIIVDEFTGRLMPGRRWSEGLHQAIEAKEGTNIQQESRTFATITFQNYFRLYKKLAGMTGTAQTSAEEFHKVYNLEVISIPTNKPMIRKDNGDKVFQSERGKFQALTREIKERHQKGQPVLIGTISIERNEYLSEILRREGIPHQLLNAKNHEKEGEIIAQAGKPGAVTIATNMAGRGVDIILGGNPFSADEAKKVRGAGGLHVVGTERHEARRIDNQLRGRSGRQGDPGESCFFVSLEDDLMRIFGSEKIKNMMGRFGIPEDEPIENRFVSSAIESAQAKIEGFNFDARKHLLEFDDVQNKQRQAIYQKRKEILSADNEKIKQKLFETVSEEIALIVNFHTHLENPAEWNTQEIAETIKATLGNSEEIHERLIEIKDHELEIGLAREKMINFLKEIFEKNITQKEEKFGKENFYKTVKNLFLQVMDMLWVEHLEMMDYLRHSVNLRAYGQREPLVEYKNEGFRLFQELQKNINMQIFNLAMRIGEVKAPQEAEIKLQKTEEKILGSAPAASQTSAKKIGRNDPCPCGSGKKYKKCHGR